MSPEDLRHARLMIVDDQEANVLLLEDILDEGGYTQRITIQDSRNTLRAFSEFKPDLVLLDLMMPHLDGFAVMEQLRPLLVNEEYLPILVLTADVSRDTKRRALAAGAKDFLTKPLDPVEVLLRIENLLFTRFLYRKLQQHADQRIEELAALIDRANDAILALDEQDRIVFWNEGAERLYGWKAAEVLGADRRDIPFRVPSPIVEEVRRQVTLQGKWSGELEQLTKTNKPIVVASRWTVVRDLDGRLKSTLIINTDITEKKSLEGLLMQAQRMEGIGLLAGGAAHDFNNILCVILGLSEVLMVQLKQGEPARAMVEEIHKAGQRAVALTRQLLAFSRKQVLTPVVLDLNALVADVQKMLRRLIGEDILLKCSFDAALGPVKADPGQIEQILINLTVNARDAMPQGGRFTIETRNVDLDESFTRRDPEIRPGPYALLAVMDTGTGMDDATRAHIFEPFFTTKEVGKGTGLGLATVYGIVKQSHGCIEVFSAPGQGTTFKVYFPRVMTATPAAKTEQPIDALPTGTETILLAEDEKHVRTLWQIALQSAGYVVLEACDGEDGVRVSDEHSGPIHLLVTDVVMPKKNGRQLADALALRRPHMKVLYVSGYTDDTVVRQNVLQAQMAFLNKPCTLALLARKVRAVLDS